MAIGLGIKAYNAEYNVLVTTIPLLVNELEESRSQKILSALNKIFEKYDLIIASELGYISFDKEASELLFTYLSKIRKKINNNNDKLIFPKVG